MHSRVTGSRAGRPAPQRHCSRGLACQANPRHLRAIAIARSLVAGPVPPPPTGHGRCIASAGVSGVSTSDASINGATVSTGSKPVIDPVAVTGRGTRSSRRPAPLSLPPIGGDEARAQTRHGDDQVVPPADDSMPPCVAPETLRPDGTTRRVGLQAQVIVADADLVACQGKLSGSGTFRGDGTLASVTPHHPAKRGPRRAGPPARRRAAASSRGHPGHPSAHGTARRHPCA